MNLHIEARVCVHCLLASQFLLVIIVALHPAGADSGSAGVYDTGIPLPAFCLEPRGDRTVSVSNDCGENEQVKRFFFHKTKHCKRFGVCPNVATYLDPQADPTINYFQNVEDCEQACTNVVECPKHPLQIENGYPVTLSTTGKGRAVSQEGERFGYGTKIAFECNEGYRLVESEESTRFCQLNGTWTGTQPHCEIQCPKPESLAQNVTISPLQPYYNVGQRIQLDCMDGLEGNTTQTCQEQGTWMGSEPVCSPSCEPQVVDNAHPPVMEMVGLTLYYTYHCFEGYSILNSSTLSCYKGTLHGETPVCTRMLISGTGVTRKNGTFCYDLEAGTVGHTLTCSLDGLQRDEYMVKWILPKKPNGEGPPEVTRDDNALTFHTAYPAQDGVYICSIGEINTSVVVSVADAPTVIDVDPPRVDYFYPDGVFKSTPGETTEILSVTVGTQPLHVTWQHNGSRVVNNTTLNNTHFSLTELIYSEMIFSKLTIDSVGEIAQGVYKMIANNGGGQAESGEAQLMLANQPARRRRRDTAFCTKDPRKVVLSGNVRRTGKTESGLPTFRLRVDRVLRGDATGITRRSVDVHIFSGATTSQLWRGQKVILSGIVYDGSVFIVDSPIESYTSSLEKTTLDC